MRWSWDETLPQSSIDRSTLDSAAHRATSELAAAPLIIQQKAHQSHFGINVEHPVITIEQDKSGFLQVILAYTHLKESFTYNLNSVLSKQVKFFTFIKGL